MDEGIIRPIKGVQPLRAAAELLKPGQTRDYMYQLLVPHYTIQKQKQVANVVIITLAAPISLL
jgi:hypothetical protein